DDDEKAGADEVGADAGLAARQSYKEHTETVAAAPLPDKDTGDGDWLTDRRRRRKGAPPGGRAAGGRGGGGRRGRKGSFTGEGEGEGEAAASGRAAAAALPPLLEPTLSTAPSVAGSVMNRTAQQAKAAEKRNGKKARRQLRQQQQQHQLLQPLLPDPEPLQPDRSPDLGIAPASLSYEYASFERYGTGIGSRLMAKMGWTQGEGLGRARQGRAEPLRSFLRPKALGLGAEG
ncbi:hypothetical protein VaNZ11_005056, partial [Volvox africanus]